MSHLHLGTGSGGAAALGLGGSAAGPLVTLLGRAFALPGFTLTSASEWLRTEETVRLQVGATGLAALDALDDGLLFTSAGSASGSFGSFAQGDAGPLLAYASASAGGISLMLCEPDAGMLVELALDGADLEAGSDIVLSNLGGVNLRLGNAASTSGTVSLGLEPIDGSVAASIDGTSALWLDARGLSATGGLDADLAFAPGGSGTGLVLGSLFGDRIELGASEAGDAIFGHLGGGDDVWLAAGGGSNQVVGGAGGDLLAAGSGEDSLFGDAGLGEDTGLVRTVTGEGALELIEAGGATSARIDLGFVGSEAGYRNLVGWYTVDADGTVRTGRAVWDEDRAGALAGGSGGAVTAANLSFNMTPEEAAGLNFFCVPDGLNMAGVTHLREGAGSDGILGTHGRSGRDAGMHVEVRIGEFGQGQVWIDLDGNGSAETLLQGRMSNRISSVDMNGAAAGGFLDNSNADGTGDNFSGFFSEIGLNPHDHDYTANLGGTGRQFRNAGANAFNPATMETEDTTWGQIGFEDLYGGVTGTKFDRDFDDSVVQVKVSAIVGESTGSDTLLGGFGADVLCGDGDNASGLGSGGDDTLVGDAGGALDAIGGSNREADWVSPLLALIEARGSWSGVVVPGASGDWSKLAAPNDWSAPGVSGIGLWVGPGRNGETTTNAEINPGFGDELDFLFTAGASTIEVDFAAFYGRERERGEVDLLDEAGDVIATISFFASGVASSDDPDFVAALAGGGDTWDGVNPGRSTLAIEASGGAAIHGLRFRAIDQNANPTDNPSDYLIEAIRFGQAEGDDLLVGGLGLDTLQGDGDGGVLSVGTGAVVALGYGGNASSSAETVLADWLADGAAFGIRIAASLDRGATWQVVDSASDLGLGSSWFTSAADAAAYSQAFPQAAVGLGVRDPAAPVLNGTPQPGNPEINESPGGAGDVIEVRFGAQLASVVLDFALLFSREGQAWPEGVGEQVRIDLVGSSGQVLGGIPRTQSEVPSGSYSQGSAGFGQVTLDGARLATLAGGAEVFGIRIVGIDDTLVGNANDTLLRGLSVGFVTATAEGGDVLDLSDQAGGFATDEAMDTILWQGPGVDGGRGDGLDVVWGFDAADDVLRFEERGTQVVRAVMHQGHLSTLVTDSLAAEGTGVLLVGIDRSELALGVNLI